MDVETLTSLALLVFYLLYQALSGRKQKQQRPPRPSAPAPRPARTNDLEEALREIQEALQGRSPAPPTPQPPAPSSSRLPEGLHSRRVPEGLHSSEVPTGLHSQQVPRGMHSPVVKGQETFTRTTYDDRFDTAEEAFEHRRTEGRAYQDRSLDDPFEQLPGEAFTPDPPPRKCTPIAQAAPRASWGAPSHLFARLRKPEQLRDAILLQEILGAPVSKRRR